MLDDTVLERREPALADAGVQEPCWKPEVTAKRTDRATEKAPAPKKSEEPASPQAIEQSGSIGKPSQQGFLRRRPLLSAIGAVLLTSVLGGGYVYVDQSLHFQSTDDAFIAARQSSLAPKVSGYITAVPVTDNQHVAAGDVIVRVDDRDYRIALEQTEAQVAAAQASIENIGAQLEVQNAQINANQAQVDQAQAVLVFAQQQAARYQHLEQTGYGSVQNSEQYTSQLRQQQAALQSAEATLNLAQRQVESLKAQRKSAIANLAQAQAQRDQARLNLSYTTVTAAQPGRVVNLGAAVGQFAQPGTSLTVFVPDETWVTANWIDAYPGRTIHGHVDSVQPGSGTAFSLLPAQNATGNYVKIVQRVPVKIVMDNPPKDVALGPGMSVVPTVRVDSNLSLFERLGRHL
jgi:membrane fusion protein (multidrug efflux system)